MGENKLYNTTSTTPQQPLSSDDGASGLCPRAFCGVCVCALVFDRESLRDPQGNGPLVGDEATIEWQVSQCLVRVRVAAVHGERLVDEIDGGVPGAAGVLLLEVLLALEAE